MNFMLVKLKNYFFFNCFSYLLSDMNCISGKEDYLFLGGYVLGDRI